MTDKKPQKDPKDPKNTAEEINRKLEKLEKLKAVLKDPRIRVEDIDEEELDALLSQKEIMEETLKNYMYQFGMSLYQTKDGNNYFKKFAYGTDIRGYGELDAHNFSVNDREPGFFEKLFEYTPAERVDLKGDIKNVVYDLYERDASMVDAFDEVIADETERCKEIIEHIEQAGGAKLDNAVNLEELQDSLLHKEEKEQEVNEEVRVIDIDEMENDLMPDDNLSNEMINEYEKTYESGSERDVVEETKLPKVGKVRRIKKEQVVSAPQKNNTNNR